MEKLAQWLDLIGRYFAATVLTASIVISVFFVIGLIAKPIMLSVWPELPTVLEETFSAPSPSPTPSQPEPSIEHHR